MNIKNWTDVEREFDEKFPHILSVGTGLASVELKAFLHEVYTQAQAEVRGRIEEMKIGQNVIINKVSRGDLNGADEDNATNHIISKILSSLTPKPEDKPENWKKVSFYTNNVNEAVRALSRLSPQTLIDELGIFEDKPAEGEFECNGAFNGKGCYEDFCEDQNCRNAPKEYNQAIADVLVHLTPNQQI